jgi:plastocyanin
MLSIFTSLLGLASLAAATNSWHGTVHDVTVGGLKPDGTPDLRFIPNNIKANPGDKVRFTL